MEPTNQPLPQMNDAQQRINNILMSNTYVLISGGGEVISQNIPLDAIWQLLESVKISLLPQLIKFYIEQLQKPNQPGS